MSAVRGTFADFKTVKTRGQCQAIIEFPIEDADHVLAVLGGIPQPSKEQWVGVAPISGVAESEGDAPDEPAAYLRKMKGGSRNWMDIPMPQQAAILVNTIESAHWIVLYLGIERASTEEFFDPASATDKEWCHEADIALKLACRIESKSELGVDSDGKAFNPNARAQFMSIEREWRNSQHGETTEAFERQRNEGPG